MSGGGVYSGMWCGLGPSLSEELYTGIALLYANLTGER